MLLILCSCIDFSSVNIPEDAFYDVPSSYFDLIDIDYDTSNEQTVKATCSVICASPLYEYTASLKLLDEDGEDVFETEKQTVSKGSLSNKLFKVSFTLDKEVCQDSKSFRLHIVGKSFSNPDKLLDDSYTVTYIYNGEKVKTETVKGGEYIKTNSITRDNLVFNGWYRNEELSVVASAQSPILRDTTLYAKMSLDAERVTNEITTNTIKSLVCISYKEKTVSGNVITTSLKTGSGVIFHTDKTCAYILTNQHVLSTASSVKSYTITDYCGNEYIGYVYSGSDGIGAVCKEYDLACMYFPLSDKVELPPISFASEEIGLNESCIALGSPSGQKNAITYGTVIDKPNLTTPISIEAVKHSAPVEHGCSGGPLLNSRLELVGINFAKQGKDDGFSNGYTIPLSLVKEFIREYTPFSHIFE